MRSEHNGPAGNGDARNGDAGNGDAPKVDAGNGDHSAEVEQWLAVPEAARKRAQRKWAASNGRRAEPVDEPDDEEVEPPKAEPRPLRDRRDRGRNPRERWIASRLRRAKEKLRAQEETIEGLNARVAELEAEVEGSNRDLAAQAASARKAEKRTPANPKPTPKAKRRSKPKRGAGLDLNSASFEQLRELGLSITQSARLIAYRDTRGGFESLDDLAAVPGFSRDTLRELSSQVRV